MCVHPLFRRHEARVTPEHHGVEPRRHFAFLQTSGTLRALAVGRKRRLHQTDCDQNESNHFETFRNNILEINNMKTINKSV